MQARRSDHTLEAARLWPELPDTIRTELENYKMFLDDAGTSDPELSTPSLLDLVWHSRMVYPARYANECVRIAGRIIDHNDDPIDMIGWTLMDSCGRSLGGWMCFCVNCSHAIIMMR